jgi:hypothetical protein
MSNRNKAKPATETPETVVDGGRSRTTENPERQEIRQRIKKPLKLDVTNVQRRLEAEKGSKIKMKWVRSEIVSYQQEIGWQVVRSDMKDQIDQYSPDGRLKSKGENIQNAEAGAFTAEVSPGKYNFLMYKDLERYEAEDAMWNKEDADSPMDSIQSAEEMGGRAGLGGDVQAYQPKQQVTLNKQREMY